MNGGRAALALVAAALLAACGSSTTGGGSGPDMRGIWDYTASQNSPAATLNGTMGVDIQSDGSFSGTLSVTQTLNGNDTQLNGALTGIGVNDQTVQFDAFLNTAGRTHLGLVRADTVSGDWYEPLNGGGTAIGTFRAVRRSP